MKTPLFSVIIPTFNRRNVLARAVNSVLRQTITDFELIIVDDGSTDDTEQYIRSIDDPRIKYYKKQNGGQNSALNMGLDLSTGKYIALLDSDDYWLNNKLEKVYNAYMEDGDVGVVYHWTGYFDGKEIKIEREDQIEGRCFDKVLKVGYLTAPTFLTFKAEAIKKIGKLDERISWCQDDDLCFMLCKSFKVKVIKEVLGVYSRDDEHQMSKNYPSKKYLDSELLFLQKWENDIVRNCGREVMIKRFLKCINGLLIIGDVETADKVYDHTKKI